MIHKELCSIGMMDGSLLEWLCDFQIGEPVGKVHSVFNEVINFISLDGAVLFSLAKERVVQSPWMMRTNDTKKFSDMCLEIEIDDYIYLTDAGSLAIHEWQWTFSGTAVWKRNLTNIRNKRAALSSSQLTVLNEFIHEKGATGGSFSSWKRFNDPDWKAPAEEVNSLYFIPFLTALEKLDQQVRSGKLGSFMGSFAGLGIGLTPSGDDFLTGLLATWQYFGFLLAEEALAKYKEEWLLALKGRTTDVSYFMLKYCLEGQVNEALLGLFENSGSDPASHLQEVLAIGSTSGTDILTGVSFAYQQLLENKEELEWCQKSS